MIPDHRLGPGVRPVWAYGNIERTVTAVPDPVTSGLYHVTVTSTGSFAAFANPIDGSTWTGGGGSVKGTIEYDVTSLNSPTTAGLPSQVDDGSHSAAMALRLFSAPAATPSSAAAPTSSATRPSPSLLSTRPLARHQRRPGPERPDLVQAG